MNYQSQKQIKKIQTVLTPLEEKRIRKQFQKYWSQFDQLEITFTYMIGGNYFSEFNNEVVQKGKPKESDDLRLPQWTSFLGIDMAMIELEDEFIKLSNKVDIQMYNLVQRSKQEIKSNNALTSNDVEALKENATKNWTWLQNLAEGIQKHLVNATEYHLFYQTLLQYKIGITEICHLERDQMKRLKYDGNYEEANDIYKSMKIHLSEYFKWLQNIETLISQSRKLNPLKLRINKTDSKIPVTMVTNYRSNNVLFHKGENVFRCKNDSPQRWELENIHQDQIKNVPSISVEICTPDLDAIEDALLLRIDLLANWTTAMKEIGEVIMRYTTSILDYWSRSNIDFFSSKTPGCNKFGISQSLVTIETLLNKYWIGSSQLGFLQSRINELKTEIEMQDDNNVITEEIHINRNTIFIDVLPFVLAKNEDVNSNSTLTRSETFIYQKRAINILINKYKELHKNWQMYKNLVEHSSDLSIICAKKDIDLSTSLSTSFTNNQVAWSKYLELLIENKRLNNKDAFLDEYPHVNVTPSRLELRSKRNVCDLRSGTQNSQIDISVPAEKEMTFFSNQPSPTLPDDICVSSVDIKHFYTRSLLPNETYSKSLNQNALGNYSFRGKIGNCFQRHPLQRSQTYTDQEFTRKMFQDKCLSNDHLQSETIDRFKINRNKPDHIQFCYLVLNLPCIDKIINIYDTKRQKFLTPVQAVEDGLCDQTFHKILDTDSGIKFNFQSAVSRGLVTMNYDNKQSYKPPFSSVENFKKVVYKIDEIYDPDGNSWVSLKEAVNRNIFNAQNGLLKTSKTDYQHVIKVVDSRNVRGRRIFHCNARSLPPEMTIEIPRLT